MSRPPTRALSPRAWALLLIPLVSLLSLAAGLMADGLTAWPLLAALVLLVGGSLALASALLAAQEADLRVTHAALSRLDAILDAATELAVVTTTPDGRITLFNAGAERLLGFAEAELLGRPYAEAFHLSEELDRAGGFAAIVRRARDGGHDEGDWTYVRKGGRRVAVRAIVTGVRMPDGRLTGFLFLAQDVTERNQARERLGLTMEAARVGTWDYDVLTDTAEWSDNVAALVGLPPHTPLTIQLWRRAVVPEDAAAVEAALKAALADTGQERYRAGYRIRIGSEVRWMEDAGRILRDAGGRALRLVGTTMDVTERVDAARALEVARDEAQRANDAKSFFLAAMSHEIRTPLAGVIGLAEGLTRTTLDDAQRGIVQTLLRAAEGLLGLVNDTLDLSKVEAGKLDLEQIPFSPRALADEARAVLAPAAAGKRLPLRVEAADDVPSTVRGDPGRLRQVLLNLLSNAVKFTAAGEVVLTVEADGPGVRFAVRDTGVGIPADRLRRIFEPFAQADRSTARTHGGTGLGLAISSKLVERMGGKLEVTSRPGAGSTFAFTLPLPLADEVTAEPERPPEGGVTELLGRSLHVLVAEDNPVNQLVMTMLLTRLGCTHELAEDGEQAVLKRQGGRFDLVLMDLQMPGMDGLRATRMIRAAERDGPRVPVVACTANAMDGERERCLAAGMDDYLTKPVRGRDLLEAIGRLFGAKEAGWRGRLAEMGFDAEGMRQLVRTFRETLPARLAALRQAADAATLKAAAHALKGSLTVFGAADAVAAADEVERRAAAGEMAGVSRLEEEALRLAAGLG